MFVEVFIGNCKKPAKVAEKLGEALVKMKIASYSNKQLTTSANPVSDSVKKKRAKKKAKK